LTIKAIQFGGNTTSLAKIFGQKDTKGNYAFINCNPKSLDDCKKIINNIIDYAQDDFLQNVDTNKPETMYNFGSHVEKFSSIGVEVEAPEFSLRTQESQQWAVENFNEDSKSLDFLKAYMKSPIFKFWSQKDLGYFKLVVDQYEKILEIYWSSQILIACYDKRADLECGNAVDKIKQEHLKLDHDLVPKLRQIYMGEASTDNKILTLIPAHKNITLSEDSAVCGDFVMYDFDQNKFFVNGYCTADFNSRPTCNIINQEFLIQCQNESGTNSPANMWVKRVFATDKEGIPGQFGGSNFVKSVPEKGYNTVWVKYTDWNSIPI